MYIIMKQTTIYKKYKNPVTGKISNWRLAGIEEPKQITIEHYNNMVEAQTVMRRLGGKEYLYKNYTCMGYIPIRLTSVSPDKMTKIVYEFTFKHREKEEE